MPYKNQKSRLFYQHNKQSQATNRHKPHKNHAHYPIFSQKFSTAHNLHLIIFLQDFETKLQQNNPCHVILWQNCNITPFDFAKPIINNHDHIMHKTPQLPASIENHLPALFAMLIIMVGFIDFLAFWYNIDIISSLFFSEHHSAEFRNLYALAIFVSGYLSRPLGAMIIGYYGDHHGRKKAIAYSLFWLSISTLLMAFLPLYDNIGLSATVLFLTVRLLQGMMFGSQLPIMWVYVSEHLPLGSIGLGGGLVMAGSVLGALLLLALLSLLSELTQTQMMAYGWRLPFLLGGVVGLVLLYLSKFLPESPFFIKEAPTQPLPLKERWQGLSVVMALSWFVSSIMVMGLLLLQDLIQLNFLIDATFLHIAWIVCLLFFVGGCLFFGFLSDHVNAGKILAIASILFIVITSMMFYDLQEGGALMLFSFALFGFFTGLVGAIPSIITRFSPVRHRLSTITIGYNVIATLTGLLLPLTLGFFTYHVSFAPALYLSFLGVLMLFLSFYIYDIPKSNVQPPTP